MGEKSIQKRRFILETARKVFVEKGFKKVTMKDIVDACEISRGGLYLYFESTSQIFQEVMKLEMQEDDDLFSDSIKEDSTAAEIRLKNVNARLAANAHDPAFQHASDAKEKDEIIAILEERCEDLTKWVQKLNDENFALRQMLLDK